jgi:two-component sensor histidine kinase
METLWPKKNDSIYVPFGAEKSSLYASLGFIKEAISERRKEFAVLRQSNDTNVLYSFNSDLGIYFNRLKMSDSAAIFFNKALELVMNKKFTPDQKEQYEFLRAVTKGNLGLSYYNSGQPEKAIPLIKEDIYYSTRGNHFESLFLSHEVIAECYILTGNFKDAEAHIDTAELVFRTHFPNGIQKKYIYFVKSKYFSATGDFKQANVFLRKYYAYLDSINLIEKEQNLKNMQIAFKIQQKEQELSEKNNILEQKELSEAREKTFRAYSIIGILILAGLVVLLIVINFLSKKRERELYAKNEQIGKQNTLIEQSLKEKEVLIREIHHRVKNNLQIITSMLSLQMSKEEGKESEAILREAKQRISSIALTHQMLYQNPNLSDIPINEYIESLVRQIEYSIPPSDIELITELQENKKKVNIDYAVPLGLLINELLTNSFKHAFPNNEKGIISVKLQEDENNCIIRVSDNGVGLPEDFNFTANKSMGMDLIHILAEQLEARLTIKSGQGSSFTLAIPKNKLFV